MTKPKAAAVGRNPAKRAEILAVAWESFLKDGYAGAAMSEITERAGGSKSTIYNHFGSKQEIFLAAMQQKGDELYASLEYLPHYSGVLADDLREFGQRLLGIVLSEEYISFYRLIVAEAARFPMVGEAEYENRRVRLLGPLGVRLHDEMVAERLRLSDSLEAAEVLWNLFSASLHRRALVAGGSFTAEEIRHLADRAVSIFLAAFGSPDGAGKPR
jgi:TetR/AcrR family transcriptional repressor of mexJK operon